jgi:Ser/Thr protein kinase RdoA (MazF antagonist)
MPEASFVAHAARTLYGIEPLSIESLDQYQHDWRGIYRVQHAHDGNCWLLRLSRIQELDWLAQVACVLDWLTQQRYPAPSVRPTIDRQLVGAVDDWACLALSYVEGSVLDGTSADELGALGQVLGRLHSLPVDRRQSFAKSRCHSEHIATAAQQLASHGAMLPQAFQPLAVNLHAAMLALQQLPEQLCMTHGDCWYNNAVRAPDGKVTLIDWDNIGLGLPLLDLGNLLLTSQFDLRQPLLLEANDAKIKAILQGYQQEHQIAQHAKASIAAAMSFLLAFQLGGYVADATLLQHSEFPFVLRKLQARYDVIYNIASIAARYIE